MPITIVMRSPIPSTARTSSPRRPQPGAQGIAYREPRSVPPFDWPAARPQSARAYTAVRRGGPATFTARSRQTAHDIFRRTAGCRAFGLATKDASVGRERTRALAPAALTCRRCDMCPDTSTTTARPRAVAHQLPMPRRTGCLATLRDVAPAAGRLETEARASMRGTNIARTRTSVRPREAAHNKVDAHAPHGADRASPITSHF